MRLLSLLTLLAATAIASAEPPKVAPVPKPVPDKRVQLDGAEAGVMFVMAAEPASKWRLEGKQPDGVELRVFDNGKSGVLVAKIPGTYGVTVTGPSGDVSQLDIVVGGDAPKPPVDPLAARLKAAYDADGERDIIKRQSHAKDLAAVYKIVAKAASDPAFMTAKDFVAFAKKSAVEMVDAGQPDGVRALSKVRDEVSKELGAIFPSDIPLTDANRTQVADLFKKLATILEAI